MILDPPGAFSVQIETNLQGKPLLALKPPKCRPCVCVKGTGSTTIAIDSRTDPGYVVSIALSPAHSVHAFERNLTHRLRRSTIRLYMHADFICDGWALKVLKVLLSIPTGKEACLLPVDCHGYKPGKWNGFLKLPYRACKDLKGMHTT